MSYIPALPLGGSYMLMKYNGTPGWARPTDDLMRAVKRNKTAYSLFFGGATCMGMALVILFGGMALGKLINSEPADAPLTVCLLIFSVGGVIALLGGIVLEGRSNAIIAHGLTDGNVLLSSADAWMLLQDTLYLQYRLHLKTLLEANDMYSASMNNYLTEIHAPVIRLNAAKTRLEELQVHHIIAERARTAANALANVWNATAAISTTGVQDAV